jgi:hypothetical protein
MAESLPNARPKKEKQRRRATRHFNKIVRQADAKAIKLFDLINDQTQRQFEFAILLHKIVVSVALVVLAVSLGIVFFPAANSYLQAFSLVGTPVSLLILLIAFLRNPVARQSRTFEGIFRLNVIFLNFIHRTQHTSLLLEQTLAEVDEERTAKFYALVKESENNAEDALAELNKQD